MGTLRCAAVGTVLLAGALAAPASAATVTLTPATLRPGGVATVTGSGFAPRESAAVRLGATARRVETDGRGRLSAVLRVAASTPAGARRLVVRVGRRRVEAPAAVVAGAQPATALVALSTGPRLVLEPTRARAGAPIRLRGSAFRAGTPVEVRFGAARLGSARASRGGSFTLAARVPPVAAGVGRVSVRWRGARVEIPFAVEAPAGARVVVAAAGDIACDPHGASFNRGLGTSTTCRAAATARLLAAAAPAAVLPLGDVQYGDDRLDGYAASYGPTWGRFNLIVHPAAGDEEYETPGAADYFAYFGPAAGTPGAGYYSFDLGGWHLVALNSECDEVQCGLGSAQEAWLRADLAAHPARCTLAYWHRARFTSGRAAQALQTDGFWRELHAAGADVVLGAHNHQYERFAPQTPDHDADPAGGIRQFVVGTGGNDLDPFEQIRANSEVRVGGAFGVLLLTLRPDGYDWRFVDTSNVTRDAGSQACH